MSLPYKGVNLKLNLGLNDGSRQGRKRTPRTPSADEGAEGLMREEGSALPAAVLASEDPPAAHPLFGEGEKLIRRSPRKKQRLEDERTTTDGSDNLSVSQPKALLKLFIKPNESAENIPISPSNSQTSLPIIDRKEPAMLRLRFGSATSEGRKSPAQLHHHPILEITAQPSPSQSSLADLTTTENPLLSNIQVINAMAGADVKVDGRRKKTKKSEKMGKTTADGAPVPKRKRRTKKAMEEARAAQAQAALLEGSGEVKKKKRAYTRRAIAVEKEVKPQPVTLIAEPAVTNDIVVADVLSAESEDEVMSQALKPSTVVDGDVVNEDFCNACRSPGYFICCETCPSSFHLNCLYPPLKGVPKGKWQCIPCRAENGLRDAEMAEAAGLVHRQVESYKALWDRLWANIVLSDPLTFVLPKRLRPKKETDSIAFFDDEEEPPATKSRRSGSVSDRKSSNGSSGSSNGSRKTITSGRTSSVAYQGPCIDKRIAESGQCHQCRGPSIVPENVPLRAIPLIPRPLIKCDKCPLLWHLDCLDPPLSTVPPGDSKWTCPAHVNLPIHPNFIPDVELENRIVDPFAFEIATRLNQVPPARKIVLPETKILLDFGAKAKMLRQQAQISAPAEVQRAYAPLLRAFSDSSVQTDDI